MILKIFSNLNDSMILSEIRDKGNEDVILRPRMGAFCESPLKAPHVCYCFRCKSAILYVFSACVRVYVLMGQFSHFLFVIFNQQL